MTTEDKLKYHRHRDAIAEADITYIRRKDAQYDASWKKRDGAVRFLRSRAPGTELRASRRELAMAFRQDRR